MSLNEVLRFEGGGIRRGSSALEILEAVGEVSVDSVIFRPGMRVGVDIGRFHDARLTVWGEGTSISLAAEACLQKLSRTGLLPSVPGMIEQGA